MGKVGDLDFYLIRLGLGEVFQIVGIDPCGRPCFIVAMLVTSHTLR